ncbi:hypothetical protein V5E97_04330 [Singulisphaera sp. Ch08]|uniref:PEP-CTERM protein-sorting domain-containing protein n=1 Tax=Singulisphaera sp. Ch08 TaxID=3120278 RepID=A0AAU7CIN4_9BACT
MRSISTHLKPVGSVFLLVLALVASTVREAVAEKIGFVTDGVVGSSGDPSSIRFDRMESAFYVNESGYNRPNSFKLGRFEIDKPTSAETVTYNNVPFLINYYWSARPEQSHGFDGTVVFRGHISGTVGLTPAQNNLSVMFDSAHVIDGNQVYTSISSPTFDFLSPSARMIFPANSYLMTSANDFSPGSSSYLSPWIIVQTGPGQFSTTPPSVPEPAMALVFVTAMGGFALCRPAFRRSLGIR